VSQQEFAPVSSHPYQFTLYGDRLFFTAGAYELIGDTGDGQYRFELWQTNGTGEGTSVVRDDFLDSDFLDSDRFFRAQPSNFIVVGRELWTLVDGTATLVADLALPERNPNFAGTMRGTWAGTAVMGELGEQPLAGEFIAFIDAAGN
jgi:hypothetical protein